MNAITGRRIGEMLLASCLIDQRQLLTALDEQRRKGGRIGAALVRLGYVSEPSLAVYLSKQSRLPCVNVGAAEIDPATLALLSAQTARARAVLPLRRDRGVVYLAVASPLGEPEIAALGLPAGEEVVQMIAPEFRLREAIAARYGG